jgi:chitinase
MLVRFSAGENQGPNTECSSDDDKFTAHAGLLGTALGSIKHPQVNSQKSTAFVKSPSTVATTIKGSSAQQCYKRLDHCVNYDDTDALRNACKTGETIVGLVQNPGCKVRMPLSTTIFSLSLTSATQRGENYPICCPEQGAPVNCLWRGGTGGASDCNGQCHSGEVKVFGDSWGGQLREPGTDTTKCTRGIKVFCCEAPLWDEVKNNCRWVKT